MLHFESRLTEATLLRRYKRFLADVTLADGTQITVHCPNTGAMTGCGAEGDRVWLSQSANAKRKYPFTWELTQRGETMICVNTHQANKVVSDSLRSGLLFQALNLQSFKSEVTFPNGHGRADFKLMKNDGTEAFLEVKSCTLAEGQLGRFPDAKSDRALKHVEALIDAKRRGLGAIMLFVAMHTDIQSVKPAIEIDPAYAKRLNEAKEEGVEVLAVSCAVSTQGIDLRQFIPVLLAG